MKERNYRRLIINHILMDQ